VTNLSFLDICHIKLTYLSLNEMIKLLSPSTEVLYTTDMPFRIVLCLMLIPVIMLFRMFVSLPYICVSQDTLSLLHVRPNGTNGDSLQVLRFIRISSEALHTFITFSQIPYIAMWLWPVSQKITNTFFKRIKRLYIQRFIHSSIFPG
jgi:hypothetical protein